MWLGIGIAVIYLLKNPDKIKNLSTQLKGVTKQPENVSTTVKSETE